MNQRGIETSGADILIADDARENLVFLTQVLTENGYRVRSAPDGARALALAMEAPPDLMLLDINMPGLTGYEVCHQVKSDPRTRHIPVLFISVMDAVEGIVKAFTVGGVDFVSKPFQVAEVLARVKTHLALQRLQQELQDKNVQLENEIEERLQVEEALREFNATLEAQVAARTAEIVAEKEKSDTILQSVGDAIIMVGPEMTIEYVNPAFSSLTGYSPKEAIGRDIYLLVGELESRPDHQALRDALSQGKSWHGELTIRRKNGRTYDAAMTIAPVRDSGGQLAGYVSSHRDISRLKDLERARSRFITNVSHELRTPVTNMILYTRMLRQGASAEKTQHYLKVIADQAERLGTLVRDILAMIELDSGQAVRTWEQLSVPAIVRDVFTRLRDDARAGGVALSVQPSPPSLPPVWGDQNRLSQALAELTKNAITYTPAGGQVTIALRRVEVEDKLWVAMDVIDTGPGIPAEEQDRVFDRFFRGRLTEQGDTPGSGLGLSIVQEILKAHGGQVGLNSTVDRGTVFTLWMRGADGAG